MPEFSLAGILAKNKTDRPQNLPTQAGGHLKSPPL